MLIYICSRTTPAQGEKKNMTQLVIIVALTFTGYRLMSHKRAVNASLEQERNQALENTIEALQERKALQQATDAETYALASKLVNKTFK